MEAKKKALIPWWWLPLGIVDVETTGLGRDDRIVQIAVVRVSRGEVADKWSSLVDPCRSIPADATSIHGISDQDVVGAPTFADLQDDIAKKLRGLVPVGYNGRFDRRFIHKEWVGDRPQNCPALDPQWPEWIDPLIWIRAGDCGVWRPSGYFSLYRVLSRLGIEHSSAHDALEDALGTFDVLPQVIKHAPADLSALLNEQSARRDRSRKTKRRRAL